MLSTSKQDTSEKNESEVSKNKEQTVVTCVRYDSASLGRSKFVIEVERLPALWNEYQDVRRTDLPEDVRKAILIWLTDAPEATDKEILDALVGNTLR